MKSVKITDRACPPVLLEMVKVRSNPGSGFVNNEDHTCGHLYCVTQAKFAASSMLPEPLYLAVCG
jgi:hypothetical protein